MNVSAVGLVTGWGEGIGVLPERAIDAAGGRSVISLGRPDVTGERFRRATRECLIGVAAVRALLREAGLEAEAIRGQHTALLYVTVGAYGSSNRAFIESAASAATLHFPYTAPSAVPAEVAIEFGLTGPYAILLGGGASTVVALWQAATLLARGACERAIVLAVETFEECADLYGRGRWLVGHPLVEAGAAALLLPAGSARSVSAPALSLVSGSSPREDEVRERVGETLACGPLIALALGRAVGGDLTGQWRGQRLALTQG